LCGIAFSRRRFADPKSQLIANFEILKVLYLIVHSDLATRTDLERDCADWDIGHIGNFDLNEVVYHL
jgi:hypothetical protein